MHATVEQQYLDVILLTFKNVKNVKYGPVALAHIPSGGLKDFYGNPLNILN